MPERQKEIQGCAEQLDRCYYLLTDHRIKIQHPFVQNLKT
jgi:hypothetical protein